MRPAKYLQQLEMSGESTRSSEADSLDSVDSDSVADSELAMERVGV
jgi:hypothetical protein